MGRIRQVGLETSGGTNAPLRLLLVEDDTDEQVLFCLAVQKSLLNLAVQRVQGGQQALDYLQGLPPFDDRERFPLPEVVVLDLRMPGVDGFTVLSWLRASARFKSLRVVTYSGTTEESWRARAQSLGADKFIAKPAGTDDWTLIVREIWEFANAPLLPPTLGSGAQPSGPGPAPRP